MFINREIDRNIFIEVELYKNIKKFVKKRLIKKFLKKLIMILKTGGIQIV